MSFDITQLARPDLRGFAGYASARKTALQGEVWLNANESPWANAGDRSGGLNRYPEPQPSALRQRLAGLYAVPETDILLGRGSDEQIDLLVRALCVAGQDAVVHTPPVFGMYAVSARLQGARLIDVPLIDEGQRFVLDEAGVLGAIGQGAKIVFLCSPANPTGACIPAAQIERILQAAQGRSLVVVDEAYIDYAAQASVIELRDRYPHLALLRTLSKAHGLAAARVGAVIADAALIGLLRNCQAPYPLPTPCVREALLGLSDAALQATAQRVATTKSQRELMARALPAFAQLRAVYASDANFLLMRCHDAQSLFDALLAAGIVVRDMRAMPGLGDALRITVGSPEENDRVIAVLQAQEALV